METSTIRERVVVGIALLCVAAAVAFVSWQEKTRADRFLVQLTERFEETHRVLRDMREASTQDRELSAADSVIADCESRAEFDALLERLDGASPHELDRAQALLVACGDVYPRRKQHAVDALAQEVARLAAYHDALQVYRPSQPRSDLVVAWEAYLTNESRRADLLFDQVHVQGEVITALRDARAVMPLLERGSVITREFASSTEASRVQGAHIEKMWERYQTP